MKYTQVIARRVVGQTRRRPLLALEWDCGARALCLILGKFRIWLGRWE